MGEEEGREEEGNCDEFMLLARGADKAASEVLRPERQV